MGPLSRKQHSHHPGPPPREPSPRVQGITPVVPATHQQHDPAAVDPPQQLSTDNGQSGGGPLHERTLRNPRHQPSLGGPYRLHAVRSTHTFESAPQAPKPQPPTAIGPDRGTRTRASPPRPAPQKKPHPPTAIYPHRGHPQQTTKAARAVRVGIKKGRR